MLLLWGMPENKDPIQSAMNLEAAVGFGREVGIVFLLAAADRLTIGNQTDVLILLAILMTGLNVAFTISNLKRIKNS